MSAESSTPAETVYCARHPETETGLSCSRCETPICPRCMIHVPVGIRCPDCADLRRPPMYELGTRDVLRGALTAAGVGLALGLAGAWLLPVRPFAGFFSMLIAMLAGSGAGSVMAAVLTSATRGKRGLTIQLIAVGGLVIAGTLRLVIGGDLQLLQRDIVGMIALALAVAVVWNRLR